MGTCGAGPDAGVGLTRVTHPEVEHWLELFNAGEYFEAHESLEGLWLTAQEPEKTFLKGLIHAAVALYQYRRGNAHGARVKCASMFRYLRPYAPTHGGLAVGSLLLDFERFYRDAGWVSDGSPLPHPTEPWPTARRVLCDETALNDLPIPLGSRSQAEEMR